MVALKVPSALPLGATSWASGKEPGNPKLSKRIRSIVCPLSPGKRKVCEPPTAVKAAV